MIPDKLQSGDQIRVVAPSRSLSAVRPNIADAALQYLRQKGYSITFSEHCRELDADHSSSIQSRVEDLHQAFLDPDVKAILTCIGGFNVNQILDELDYTLIQSNPKILCGYSDITALLNAIYAKTGLVTYHGPHFSSFGYEDGIKYTNCSFEECLLQTEPYVIQPSNEEPYKSIQEGVCEGEIVGGNLCTLNLLQGTPYLPDLAGKILFLEDDNIMGDYFVREFDRNLQSLVQTAGFAGIKGIVFGRFEESCKMDLETIRRIVSAKKKLSGLPVVFNADFGHIRPFATFPIGGKVRLEATKQSVSIEVLTH